MLCNNLVKTHFYQSAVNKKNNHQMTVVNLCLSGCLCHAMTEMAWLAGGGKKAAKWSESTGVLCSAPGPGYVGWWGAIQPAVSRV